MKFLSFALFFVLPALSMAQGVVITNPSKGATFIPGESFTVTVTEPNSLTGSTGVAVAIGLQSCEEAPTNCPSSNEVFGSVLASGPWTPTKARSVFQNFTVAVPSSFPAGPAKLNVAYFTLIGANPQPELELIDVALNIY